MSKQTRILIAQEKNCIDVLLDALAGYELITATHLQEAERLLIENGIDMFVIGIHFDDSRAMELVKFIRDDEKHKKTPIVMVRFWPSEHAQILRQTIEVMKTVRAVSAYIEADADTGNRPFMERVREAVERHLPARKRTPALQKIDPASF